jgi:hypothetical protein
MCAQIYKHLRKKLLFSLFYTSTVKYTLLFCSILFRTEMHVKILSKGIAYYYIFV